MTTERTPQDVLRELREIIEWLGTDMEAAEKEGQEDSDLLSWRAAVERARRFLADKAIAEGPDSPSPAAKGPVVGWRWDAALGALHRNGLTYEDQPEGIRAALAFAAAAPDTFSEKPGLDVERLERAQYWRSALSRSIEEVWANPAVAEFSAFKLAELVNRRLASRGVVLAVDANKRDAILARLGSTDSEGR